MSYASRDTSVSSGAPIELYALVVGNDTYRWTSSDEDVTYLGNVYTSSPVVRAAMSQGDEPAQSYLELSFPPQHPILSQFAYPSSGLVKMTLTMYAGHRGESEFWVLFSGRSISIESKDSGIDISMTVRFARIDGLLTRKVPRMQIAPSCQNMLFDQRCSLLASDWKFDSVITEVDILDNRNIEIQNISGMESGHGRMFVGGVVLIAGVAQGVIAYRGSGDWIGVLDENPRLVVGQAITIYPGCDRSINTCVEVFGNIENFNGWHTIPARNPFEGLALEETMSWRGNPRSGSIFIDTRGY